MMKGKEIRKLRCDVEAITRGPSNHYFGYYDKRQFDGSGRYALGLKCGIFDRMQSGGDAAELGMIDLLKHHEWIPIGKTRAWNWQFGCMAQWMPAGGEVVYNDGRSGKLCSIVLHPASGRQRVIPHPVFDVHPAGRLALTLDFSRLWHLRPETGFHYAAGGAIPHRVPEDDGLFTLDLETGGKKLIVSLAGVFRKNKVPSMENACHYITHPLWNRDGSRLLFWHRWKDPGEMNGPTYSRVYTVYPDGSGIFLLMENNSHTAWLGSEMVLVWAVEAERGGHYYLCRDRTAERDITGEGVLTGNGHFTFSPCSRWLVTDTPIDRSGERAVLLYCCRTGECFEIARFLSHPSLGRKELRCDLHPRWHPDGRRVCVDSSHEGSRQMYLIDAGEVVSSSC